MKIAIELIKVDEEVRIRKEIGNLQPLVDSIAKVGLINPILIDEQSNLVAGYRRLAACKKLNMKEVDVRIVEFGGDMMKMLDVEVAENFFRKDFTPEEVLATERRRQEILEATRKKGFFQRLWLWLKSLFSQEPTQKLKPASYPPSPLDGPADLQERQVDEPIEQDSTEQSPQDRERVPQDAEDQQEPPRNP